MEERCISFKELKTMLGVARATVDRWENTPEYAHLGFPKRVRLGQCRICWLLSEISAWLTQRPRA
jgi:predicted DNA-binding transcriptional regulator AlpA